MWTFGVRYAESELNISIGHKTLPGWLFYSSSDITERIFVFVCIVIMADNQEYEMGNGEFQQDGGEQQDDQMNGEERNEESC
jgi:hypothetical protein